MKIFKFIAVLALVACFQTRANIINIELSSNQVTVGDTIKVNLLANFADEVDSFNFDFNFDNSIFEFVDGSVLTELQNDGWNYFFELAASPVGVGINYLSFADVLSGEFLLASFDLKVLQFADAAFSLTTLDLFNSVAGQDYSLSNQPEAFVSSVPSPSISSLFILAFATLTGLHFRRKKRGLSGQY